MTKSVSNSEKPRKQYTPEFRNEALKLAERIDDLPEYNIKTIAASLRHQGLLAKASRKRSPVSYCAHDLPVSENLLKWDFTVDAAIPFGFAAAVGAVRVAAVRSGRISLAMHESMSGAASGGHTVERHIGKKAGELFARLERRPHCQPRAVWQLTQCSAF